MTRQPRAKVVAQENAPLHGNSLAVGCAGGTISHVKTALCWPGSGTVKCFSPSAGVPALVTPASATEERRNNSVSPTGNLEDARLPSPFVLERQPSQATAWMSEIDSHYHSDKEDESSWEEDPRSSQKSLNLSEVHSQGTFRPPSIITAVTPSGSPSNVFVDLNVSGDETSDKSSKRARYRRKRTKPAPTTDSNSAILAIYQERLEQAEGRTVDLSQRLAVAERSHREVTEDLREAMWETTRLHELVEEQRAKISKLEAQQQITKEWSLKERSALLDELKETQEKLIVVEEDKMALLKELAVLQKQGENDSAMSSKLKQEKEELLAKFEKLNDEVDQLRTSKQAVEVQLQVGLGKQQELQTAVADVHRELQDQKNMNQALEETKHSLSKRVRFADQQLEAAEHRSTELEIRLGTMQSESEQARRDFGQQIKILESSLESLQGEKQDLYQAWQQALGAQRETQSKLEHLQVTSTEDKELLRKISAELESTISAKKELESSYQVKLREQTELVAQEKAKAQTQQQEYEARLNDTLQKVMQTQHTLDYSQGNILSLESERQSLLSERSSLQARLQANQATLVDMDSERMFLKQTLEDLQVEHARVHGQREQAHSDLQCRLQEAEAAAVTRQVEALNERRALEQELERQTKRVQELEWQVHSLQKQCESFAREKEELVQQAAELQTALLDEGPKQALKAMEADRDRLQDVAESLQVGRIALQEEFKESLSKLANLETQLNQALAQQMPLQQQADSASERAASLEHLLAQARRQTDDLQLAHEELSAEHLMLLNHHQKSAAEIQELQMTRGGAENTIRGLEHSRQELQLKIDELEVSRASLKAELEEAEALFAKLEKTHVDSRESLQIELSDSSSEVAKLRMTVGSLESKIDVLKANFDADMNSLNATGKAELATFRAKIAALKLASDKKVEALQAELTSKRKKLEDIGTELDSANAQLQTDKAALEAARRQNESLSARLEVSASSVEYLDSELTLSKSQIVWLTTEREALTLVNTDLQAKLDEAEVRTKALVSEKGALQTELGQLRNETHLLTSKLQDALSGREHLEAQLLESTDLNKVLEARSREMDEEIVLLQGVGIELRAQVGDLEKELVQLTSIRDALVAEHGAILTKRDQAALELSKKVDVAESEKIESLFQVQILLAELETMKSQKLSVETRFGEIERALSIAENLLSMTRDELSSARQDRDTVLLHHQNLEQQYSDLQLQLEKTQRDMIEMEAEKEKLCTENYELAEKLKGVLADFTVLQATNQDVLWRHGQLESQSNQLRHEVALLQSEKLELLASCEEQSSSTAAMMEVITKEKYDLREQVNLLETEKGVNIAELSSARKAIVQLEFEIMTIQEEAQQAKDNHGSIVNDLARLEEDRAILQQEVQRLSRELAEVQGELKTAEVSARETNGKLSRAEEEKFQLTKEKCSAVAHQSVLETEVNMNRLKIASLEKNLNHFEEKIRSLEVEKRKITAQEKDALETVETAKREEEKLKKDLAETKRIISDLKTENSSIAFRAESAEASVAVLKKDIEEASHLTSLAVEQLGKKVLEGKKAMRKLAKELEASNQTNDALKRAAKYLMKRVRELETLAEKTEQSFVFSCDLSTEELKTSGD